MEYKLLELSNGIRVIHKPAAGSGITHLCFMVNTGSRDEPNNKMGLAHFLEHLLFKGTQKRNTYQILNRLEVVGGDLNAYTTKEQTCIHASFLDDQLERALELITDIAFHSTFPQNEIEKEKGVVLDELDSYKDMPEELIQDEFDEIIFDNHPLGNNILGTPESIAGFTREDISNFTRNTWSTHEMVIGIFGNLTEKKLQRLIDKYLNTIPENRALKNRITANGFHRQVQSVEKPISQTHCILGGRSYTIHDPQKTGMLLLNNLLAGPGMSARLNLEIREKFGACYTIESSYTPMSDTGIFSIYFGTDGEKTEKCLKLIHKELKKLREQPLSSLQLSQAKQRFKGQIALAEEHRVAVIIGMSKSLLDYNTIDSIQEIFRKIDKVSATELQQIANENLFPEQLSMLTYLPTE